MADNNEEKVIEDIEKEFDKSKELKPFDIPDFCKFLRDLIKTYLID